MSKKNTNKQIDQSAPSTEELKREIELLRLENAYLKVASFSGESEGLSRKAQAAVTFALKKEGFKLKDILLVVGIPETTYHYHVKQFGKENTDQPTKELIKQLFQFP